MISREPLGFASETDANVENLDLFAKFQINLKILKSKVI